MIGRSFTKKAQVKFSDILALEDCKEDKYKIEETKIEFCFYLLEAIYYFTVAERQIREEKIIEIGKRRNYQKFLNDVGVLALSKSLLMFEKSVDEIKGLLEELKTIDVSIWKENKSNELNVTNNIEVIGMIKKSILDWKTNLENTVKTF